MFPHLHHVEVPLSSVNLTTSEEAGEVALRYGLSDSTSQRRPRSMASPLASFFAPYPSARRAAPPRRGPATSAT
jgi:hypothetical protein